MEEAQRRPQTTIVFAALFLRLSTSLLLLLTSSLLPSFRTDATPLSVPLSPYLQPFLRWDAVHFVHIALDVEGYGQEERSAAFLPGLPVFVMRKGGGVVAWISGKEKVGADEVVLAGMIGTTLATTGAALLLYRFVSPLLPSPP
jgi:phosphatidylinositol glycan class V